jgi:hypothetical protein
MRQQLMMMISALLASCQPTVECGPGTIERGGVCEPADLVVSGATCGPFTRLEGGVCVPELPPTRCDPASTQQETGADNVITCIGTGSGFACPDPQAGKQTICGQLHDLATGQPFADPGAECARCTGPSDSGPCSLGIVAYDALEFGTNPQGAQPLAVDEVYVDDCGRFKLENITLPTGPFIGLGIDDAQQGPQGTTNAVGVATLKTPGLATKDIEAFVVDAATTTAWTQSGGPSLAGGMFVAIFRATSTGQVNQPGVTVTRGGQPIPNDDHYFVMTEAVRMTIDPQATATGANGTAIIQPASVAEGVVYSAQRGPLPPECAWTTSAGVALPGIVFVQIFRPIDAGAGQDCPL